MATYTDNPLSLAMDKKADVTANLNQTDMWPLYYDVDGAIGYIIPSDEMDLVELSISISGSFGSNSITFTNIPIAKMEGIKCEVIVDLENHKTSVYLSSENKDYQVGGWDPAITIQNDGHTDNGTITYKIR